MKIIIIFIYNTDTFLVYDTFVNTSVSNKNQKAYRLENIKLNRAEGVCLGCVSEANSPYSLALGLRGQNSSPGDKRESWPLVLLGCFKVQNVNQLVCTSFLHPFHN